MDFGTVDLGVLILVRQRVLGAHIDTCEGTGQHKEDDHGNDDFLEESGFRRELPILPNDIGGF